ncbi:MAG: outer membrane beta-barrel protein, partial [Terricaulis sp.]
MKSRITKTMALAALLTGTAGVASATEGWYGRADAGWAIDGQAEPDGGPSVNLDSDWTQHLGLGYAFENGLRFEGELGHRFNQLEDGGLADIVDGDVHAWSAMANLFYDFNRGGGVEPYVGVGVGAARINGYSIDGSAFGIDDQDTMLAYQAMVGLAAPLTDNLDLDVGYRYFMAPGGTYATHGGPPANLDVDYEHQA